MLALAVLVIRDQGMPQDVGASTAIAIAIATMLVAGLIALSAVRRRRRSRC